MAYGKIRIAWKEDDCLEEFEEFEDYKKKLPNKGDFLYWKSETDSDWKIGHYFDVRLSGGGYDEDKDEYWVCPDGWKVVNELGLIQIARYIEQFENPNLFGNKKEIPEVAHVLILAHPYPGIGWDKKENFENFKNGIKKLYAAAGNNSSAYQREVHFEIKEGGLPHIDCPEVSVISGAIYADVRKKILEWSKILQEYEKIRHIVKGKEK